MNFKSSRIAIVRVSPKAGNVKHLWVYEERANGWIHAGPDQAYSPGRTFASWHAPHHILRLVDLGTVNAELGPYDWNGIPPGTLVDIWGGARQGLTVARKGAKYEVLMLGDGQLTEVTWESVVPVVLED